MDFSGQYQSQQRLETSGSSNSGSVQNAPPNRTNWNVIFGLFNPRKYPNVKTSIHLLALYLTDKVISILIFISAPESD